MTRPRILSGMRPTGPLHIGTARTALFNYLFARRQGGTFILRLEDTDVAKGAVYRGAPDEQIDRLRWNGAASGRQNSADPRRAG